MSDTTFKTIYFPRERCKSGQSARVPISLPTDLKDVSMPETFLTYVRSLSSREFRIAIGDPFLEDLEQYALSTGKSLSSICLYLLMKRFTEDQQVSLNDIQVTTQLTLPSLSSSFPISNTKQDGNNSMTFRESQRQPVHGWYPYVEGFSATYVRNVLLKNNMLPRVVYDPFGGAGTTQLVASCLGVPSFYSEVNPFMAFVAETKVHATAWARQHIDMFQLLATEYISYLTTDYLQELGSRIDLDEYYAAFPERNFFEEHHLRHLLAACNLARTLCQTTPHIQSLLLLACAANAVGVSNMTRRADLRRRRADEYRTRVVDVATFIRATVKRIVSDLQRLPPQMAEMIKISADCRQIPHQFTNSFDMAITSPPYLNGTNYFRNTKIELWLLGFIKSEHDLKAFRKQAVTSGINNVIRSREDYLAFESVEQVARELDMCSSDLRIPALVRHYFSDMEQVLASVFRSLAPNGRFFMDIGDSQFYGVHVPTDKLLLDVAHMVGFEVEYHQILAKRYSRDKSDLVQVELILRKPQENLIVPSQQQEFKAQENRRLEERIRNFGQNLPYKQAPYTSKNWGHPLHSLCSYQGKLKPSIAYWLIREFVPAKGRILDPLGGVGTIPFEAALTGCVAVSNDKSPLAATITSAKLNPPTIKEVEEALASIEQRMSQIALNDRDYQAAEFGLNATVIDYYHPETLEEILRARRIFLRDGYTTRGEAFVWASLLHILHGNRPYALSRISHPITPFHPKGTIEYKNLIEKVWGRVKRSLGQPLPNSFQPGESFTGDFRDLPEKIIEPFDVIVTSPPFIGMRFDRPNWLRLWFCGWSAADFHETSLSFLDRQQTKSSECYIDFFSTCHTLLKTKGLLIVHVGSGRNGDLVDVLKQRAIDNFCLIEDVYENVQSIEQHGLKDKGRTTTHHFLFFQPL